MYIVKNAFRCIGRAKGRNILIGIIALVIAISACLGLSIRQAAESAKTSALAGMSITATISFNRNEVINQLGGGRGPGSGGSGGGFDRDQFTEMMSGASDLTLEEYKTYATAGSVQSFYYTLTAYFDGSDTLSPVESSSSSSGSSGFPMGGGMGGGMPGGMSFSTGEFTIVGYSGDNAMTEFMDGTASILEDHGSMFEEGTTDYVCVISEELANYNTLAVGDTVTVTNPNLATETYTLSVVGIYSSTATNDFSMSTMFGASQDPANRIYMSAAALQLILDASDASSVTLTDSYNRETQSRVTGTLDATYVFADVDAYNAFEDEVRALGLSDSYIVSSSDIQSFENSLTPLNSLSDMAGVFLIVILIIGGIILVVLNIFNVRERKYEVGVLTAMGMKKWKVAAQFMCEILVVTMIAVLIGAAVGAVSSVPVTNALLENQTVSQSNQQSQMEGNFGRPGNFGGGMPSGMPSDMPSGGPSGMPGMGGSGNPFGNMGNMFDDMLNEANDYITEVDSAMNLTVVFQMIGVGLLLTIVASAASVLFIMRYDPLKILANRD